MMPAYRSEAYSHSYGSQVFGPPARINRERSTSQWWDIPEPSSIRQLLTTSNDAASETVLCPELTQSKTREMIRLMIGKPRLGGRRVNILTKCDLPLAAPREQRTDWDLPTTRVRTKRTLARASNGAATQPPLLERLLTPNPGHLAPRRTIPMPGCHVTALQHWESSSLCQPHPSRGECRSPVAGRSIPPQ